MENFFCDKGIWIVGTMCLVASFLWRRIWSLFTHKRKTAGSASANIQLKETDGEKPNVFLKELKKKRHQDVIADLEEVKKLNLQNSQLSHGNAEAHGSAAELQDFTRGDTEKAKEKEEPEEKDEVENISIKSELDVILECDSGKEEQSQKIQEDDHLRPCEVNQTSVDHQERPEELVELIGNTKRRVVDKNLCEDDLKKSRVEKNTEAEPEPAALELETERPAALEVESERPAALEVESERPAEEKKAGDPLPEEFLIDCAPPPPAPFEHRVVSSKTHQIASYYDINRDELLGGGRFGVVHKCVEKSSGLTFAAKVIKIKNHKEKEVVKSEIEVMNQLNHATLIQLYAAYESRNDITLIMEYVEGGELFDRIIDENYKLTELDTVLLIRQITEGLQYMHKMYILHLDLKPENILCVSRETNKIKIIDFGLARRYKPREKLRVNFGTPEFLAPEVINYEFVSFPTDMWSLGVITYMVLSGFSPFLGDDDNETLNNILECKWSFEEAEFAEISEEAKDFITCLLVKSKSWRMSASQSLKHPWLSDKSLHYRLHLKKNKCHPTHVPSPES